MHIFNCIDLFCNTVGSVALAAPWVGLKENRLGTTECMPIKEVQSCVNKPITNTFNQAK